MLKIKAIYGDRVIYTLGDKIIDCEIEDDAMMVLRWFNRHIPANDNNQN